MVTVPRSHPLSLGLRSQAAGLVDCKVGCAGPEPLVVGVSSRCWPQLLLSQQSESLQLRLDERVPRRRESNSIGCTVQRRLEIWALQPLNRGSRLSPHPAAAHQPPLAPKADDLRTLECRLRQRKIGDKAGRSSSAQAVLRGKARAKMRRKQGRAGQ